MGYEKVAESFYCTAVNANNLILAVNPPEASMASRDLTVEFLELRTSNNTFLQLDRWTKDVDRLLTSSHHDPCNFAAEEDGAIPVGAAQPWIDCANAVELHCNAIKSKLRCMTSLHRQRLLVTFDTSQEETVDQDLREITVIIQESLCAAEAMLSAPRSEYWCDIPDESDASRSSRLNARKSLAKRLQDLGCTYRTMQKEFASHTARQNVYRTNAKRPGSEVIEAKSTEINQLKPKQPTSSSVLG